MKLLLTGAIINANAKVKLVMKNAFTVCFTVIIYLWTIKVLILRCDSPWQFIIEFLADYARP